MTTGTVANPNRTRVISRDAEETVTAQDVQEVQDVPEAKAS